MAGKIEQAELALTESVVQTEKAFAALDDVVEGIEVAGGVPGGWADAQISDVAEVKGGKRLPKGKKLTSTETDHPYIRVTDFDQESVDITNIQYIDNDTFEAIKNYTISSDDLYISIAGTIGLVGEVPTILSGANLTENAAKLCQIVGATKNYLKYVLNSSLAKAQFEDKTTSSGQPKLALFRIKDCHFPLPPLAEQTVIAQTLDTLLAQVDNIKARLDAIPNILKTFRQSVLAAAVSGKLTEEWRGESEWESNTGDLKKWVDIDIGNAFKSKEFTDEGIPLLRGQNIEPGALRWRETKYFPESKLTDYKHLYIKDKDIILAMDRPVVAAGLKLARAKSVDLPCVLVQRVARFKDFQSLEPDYLYLLLQDVAFTNYLVPNQTGSDIPHISGKQILSYPVAIPPLEEQTQIVRRVEELFAFADQIEQQVKNAQGRVNNLTQSILAKAFRGELTVQWRAENTALISGENSAEALLAKIQAEREKLKPKKKSSVKKTTRKKTTAMKAS